MKRTALIAAIVLSALSGGGSAQARPWESSAFWRGSAGFAAASPIRSAGKESKKPRSERPAEGKTARQAENAPLPKGPLHIIVSIGKQRATLFADGEPIASSKISSGTPGHPTPMGIFSVIQKSRHHVSNLYDAPMPYMQRITWSGSALHEGPLPGYPASHGCVRLTTEFAQLLWKSTKIGARVIITQGEVKPEPIEHAALDALAVRPLQAERIPEAPTAPALKVADAADAAGAAFASAKKPAAAARAERVAEPVPTISDAPAHTPIMPIVSVPALNASHAQATKRSDTDRDSEPPVVLAAPPSPVVEPTLKTPTAAPPAAEPPVPVPVLSPPTQPTKSAELATRGPANAPSSVSVIEPAAAPTGIDGRAPQAIADATVAAPRPSLAESKTAAPMIIDEPPRRALPPAATGSLRGREPARKPVSLFVSLKDAKLYARQGMEPLFEMPISIPHPEQPLGTHVFTAMATKDGGGLRWTVVSIPSHAKRSADFISDERPPKKRGERRAVESPDPPVPNAAAALDRIVLPQSAMERIAGLVAPGASLIVSDNPLSDETNNATEFIVLTR